MTAVERWFGAGFSELHPGLQELHRRGGVLHGVIRVGLGRGVAGWLGARLARKLGIGGVTGMVALHVDIHSDEHVLHWDRKFGDGGWMRSEFRPIAAWPDGHWLEQTGAIRMALAVDTDGGGWRWRPLRMWWHGIRLPLWLVPRLQAHKAIRDDDYEFQVGLSYPLLGTLLTYGGRLSASLGGDGAMR